MTQVTFFVIVPFMIAKVEPLIVVILSELEAHGPGEQLVTVNLSFFKVVVLEVFRLSPR